MRLSAWPIHLAAIWCATLVVTPSAAQEETELPRLIERIAHGDPDQAAEATDELVQHLVRPLTAALGAIEQRPPAEQRRLRAALRRVTAVLRLQLCRANLPLPERELFDEFARHHAELVEALFAEAPRHRLEALHQIPLEPNTGAGVLIITKINDWDPIVSAAALEAASLLNDDVVIRGLTRYIADVTAAARAGEYGPARQDYELVLADFTRRAILILGNAGARDSIPVIADAVRLFGRSPHRKYFQTGQALEALGQIGDERAVPLLLEFLNERDVHQMRSLAPGTLLRQTVGDAALLALARVYGLSPKGLGFQSSPAPDNIIGFTDEDARAAAVRAFGRWHKENAGLPRAQRSPLTTQPADED